VIFRHVVEPDLPGPYARLGCLCVAYVGDRGAFGYYLMAWICEWAIPSSHRPGFELSPSSLCSPLAFFVQRRLNARIGICPWNACAC
jgi:hypothetical protein